RRRFPMKLTALSVVVVCLSLQAVTAKPIPASEIEVTAVIYFYRGIALTNHPASVYIDEDEVCSVHPKMFCVVDVKPGNHGFAQFSKRSESGKQESVFIEPGREYYFAFKPNNFVPLACGLMNGYCEVSGWRLVLPESGKKEIRGLKQEEIVVPPGVFSGTDRAHFETILVRLGDRVETSFVFSASDYGVKDRQSATLVEVKGWGDWIRNTKYHFNYPVTAPVRGNVLLTLSVSYDYAAPLKKGEEPTPEKLASFLRTKTSSLYYFFVFNP